MIVSSPARHQIFRARPAALSKNFSQGAREKFGLGTIRDYKGVASFPGSSAPERDIEVVHAESIFRVPGEPGNEANKGEGTVVSSPDILPNFSHAPCGQNLVWGRD